MAKYLVGEFSTFHTPKETEPGPTRYFISDLDCYMHIAKSDFEFYSNPACSNKDLQEMLDDTERFHSEFDCESDDGMVTQLEEWLLAEQASDPEQNDGYTCETYCYNCVPITEEQASELEDVIYKYKNIHKYFNNGN